MTTASTASEEVRVTSSTGAQKGMKPEAFDLIPGESLEWTAVAAGQLNLPDPRVGDLPWSVVFNQLQSNAWRCWHEGSVDPATGLHRAAAVAVDALWLTAAFTARAEGDDRLFPVSLERGLPAPDTASTEPRFDLLPYIGLAEVARLYRNGAEKYAAHNWAGGYRRSLSFAAMQRHANQFWSGQDEDPEMGLCHMASVVFHALALIYFDPRFPELDDRPFHTIGGGAA